MAIKYSSRPTNLGWSRSGSTITLTWSNASNLSGEIYKIKVVVNRYKDDTSVSSKNLTSTSYWTYDLGTTKATVGVSKLFQVQIFYLGTKGESQALTRTFQFYGAYQPTVSASWDSSVNKPVFKITAHATDIMHPRSSLHYTVVRSGVRNGKKVTATTVLDEGVLGWDSNSTLTYPKTYNETMSPVLESDYFLYTMTGWALDCSYKNSNTAITKIYAAFPAKASFLSQTKTSSGTNVVINSCRTDIRPTEKIQVQINYADKAANLASDKWTDIGTELSLTSAAAFSVFLDDGDITPEMGQHVWIRAKATAQNRTVYSNIYQLSDKYYFVSETGSESEAESVIAITNATYGRDSESLEVTIGYETSSTPAYNACELSYSKDNRAWLATKQPETYEMKDSYWKDATSKSSKHANTSSISVLELDADTTYYLRARRYVASDKDNKHTRWSKMVSANTSQEELTGLVLSADDLVAVKQECSFAWSFPDGLEQTQWYLYDATTKRTLKYGTGPITSCSYAFTSSGSKVVYLVSRYSDGRSMTSDEVSVLVEPKPTLSFSVAPLATLKALPQKFTIKADMENADIQVKVFALGVVGHAPDGDVEQYVNDVVWSEQGTGKVECEINDGSALWQNGTYQIQAVATANGIKSDVLYENFSVAYTETVSVPDASDVTITPLETKGATIQVNNLANGITWDLYRATKDGRNFLLAKDQVSGATITDDFAPYSSTGANEYIVLVKNAQGQYEYASYGYEAKGSTLRFDWNGNYVELPYNIEISDELDKQFEQQVYLDGTQKGAWASSVVRKASLKTDTIFIKDEETQKKIRELGRYQDAVFVRTPLGQAYTANVEVKDVSKVYGSNIVAVSFECTEIDLTQDFSATI